MSDSGRPLTPYEAWIEQRQQQAQQAQDAGMRALNSDGWASSPRNFMPPDQRRTWVVPAGTSQFGEAVDQHVADGRVSADQRRLQHAQVAREAERESRLSGSSHISSPREDARRGWESKVVRDGLGRLRVDWQRVAAEEGEVT